jgi:serine/threonine-protein kinase HipA
LADCSPDRWGRNLILKEHRHAQSETRPARTLTDVDFLIAVSDMGRQGAVRISAEPGGPFQAPGGDIPKVIDLPRLLNAANAVDDDADFAAIKALLDAGSASLGGARPKASVLDEGKLLVAKFPHQHDEWDVMAWEKVTLDLAGEAGIGVPANRLARVDEKSVLLLERFDRDGGKRIPYISAMTLLEARDGEAHDYLEVADALAEVSASATEDLHQLWRRVLFMALVNNTDDHLRNHGLVHVKGGWRLAPAFDMNPNPDSSRPRVTTFYGEGLRAGVLAALHDHAADFRLSVDQARQAHFEVATAVGQWSAYASRARIHAREIDRMDAAFEVKS